jgi:hypothetical protein
MLIAGCWMLIAGCLRLVSWPRSLAPNAQSLYGFFLMGIFEDEYEYEEEDEED